MVIWQFSRDSLLSMKIHKLTGAALHTYNLSDLITFQPREAWLVYSNTGAAVGLVHGRPYSDWTSNKTLGPHVTLNVTFRPTISVLGQWESVPDSLYSCNHSVILCTGSGVVCAPIPDHGLLESSPGVFDAYLGLLWPSPWKTGTRLLLERYEVGKSECHHFCLGSSSDKVTNKADSMDTIFSL